MSRTATRWVVGLVLLMTAEARAGQIIQEVTAGSFVATNLFPGVKVTLAPGDSYYDIKFHFYSNISNTVPAAVGTVYVLSQQFTQTVPNFATPNRLNTLDTSAPGYLTKSTGIIGGVYQFDPNFKMLPNTSYWFYATSSIQTSIGGTPLAGGAGISAVANILPYIQTTLTTPSYTLRGTIPEPSTVVVAGLGVLVLGGWQRLRRGHAPA